MKNTLRMWYAAWYTVFAIVVLLFTMSCGHRLQQLIDTQNRQDYCYFEYVDMKHIKVTAKKAIWLTDGYPAGDTILLNPKEFILLKLPDDEYNVSVGNGDDDVMSFTF